MFGVFDVTKAFINQYLKEIYTRNHIFFKNYIRLQNINKIKYRAFYVVPFSVMINYLFLIKN